MTKLIFLLCSVFLFCGFAFGNDIYVDRTNSNPSPDGTEGNPYPTITAAITNAVNGDTIYVKPGEYREGNTVSGITVSKSVELVSTDGPLVTSISVFNPSQAFAPAYRLVIISGATVSLRGFRLFTDPVNENSADNAPLVYLQAATQTVTIDNCIFAGLSAGVDRRLVAALLIENSNPVTVTISNSVFRWLGPPFVANLLTCTSANDGLPRAGAIYVNNPNAHLTITDSGFDQIRCGAILFNSGMSLTVQNTAFHYIFGTAIWYVPTTGSLTLEGNSFMENSELDSVERASAIQCGASAPSSSAISGNVFCGRKGQVTISSQQRNFNTATCGTNLRPTSAFFTDQLSPGCFCGDDSRFVDSCGTCFGWDSSCTPKTIYADPAAPPSGNGSAVAPFNTFKDALQSATHGTTIILERGTFDVQAEINPLTSLQVAARGVYIKSKYPQAAVLQCGATSSNVGLVIASTWEVDFFTVSTLTTLSTVFEGISFRNCFVIVRDSSPLFKDSLWDGTKTNSPLVGVTRNPGSGGVMPVFEGIRVRGSNTSPTDGLVRINGAPWDYATFSNSVFESVTSGGAIALYSEGSAKIVDSVFTNNAGANGADIVVEVDAKNLYITGNYFSSEVSTLIGCSSSWTGDLTDQNNVFCPSIAIGDQCDGLLTPTISGTADSCGVCDGGDQAQDCLGECWGVHVPDWGSAVGCCFAYDKDCNQTCEGISEYDPFGVCCLPNLIDCFDHCYGPADIDNNGICCNVSLWDCLDICNGSTVADIYGTCCLPQELNSCSECNLPDPCNIVTTQVAVTTRESTTFIPQITTVQQETTEEIQTTRFAPLQTTAQAKFSSASSLFASSILTFLCILFFIFN